MQGRAAKEDCNATPESSRPERDRIQPRAGPIGELVGSLGSQALARRGHTE